MRETILSKLRKIEEDEKVRILLAVESGSRAWDFASPDSDYDVRFLYVRAQEDYLRLEQTRDVIELPINEELDINGWDLQKALRLLYQSNPTLFEWLSSPIVYLETELAQKLRSIAQEYFSVKKSLYHYVSMAEGNYRDYLKQDLVRAKKYFYVLRPILACRWILEKRTAPPMAFSDLAEAELPSELRTEVSRLLDLKTHSCELNKIPRIDCINEYLDSSIESMKELAKSEPDIARSWDSLNTFFLSAVHAAKPD